MKKVNFITMFGLDVVIGESILSVENVTAMAEEHYKAQVECVPGIFGISPVSTGWEVRKKDDASILGYMILTTGWFMDIGDFDYGINMFVPFSENWSRFHNYRVRYADGMLQIESK